MREHRALAEELAEHRRRCQHAEAILREVQTFAAPTGTLNALGERVADAVGELLRRVDEDVEQRFSSTAALLQAIPLYGDSDVQRNLALLRTWHNSTRLLRLRQSLLEQWMYGSATVACAPRRAARIPRRSGPGHV